MKPFGEKPANAPGNGSATKPGGAATLGERVDRASRSAEEMWKETRGSLNDLRDAIDVEGRTTRNPYGTLAAALGLGYVLGGGLFTPLTGRIVGAGLRIGIRLAVLPLLEAEVLRLAETFAAGAVGGRESRSAEIGPAAGP
jgi:hypothetical protein